MRRETDRSLPRKAQSAPHKIDGDCAGGIKSRLMYAGVLSLCLPFLGYHSDNFIIMVIECT